MRRPWPLNLVKPDLDAWLKRQAEPGRIIDAIGLCFTPEDMDALEAAGVVERAPKPEWAASHVGFYRVDHRSRGRPRRGRACRRLTAQ